MTAKCPLPWSKLHSRVNRLSPAIFWRQTWLALAEGIAEGGESRRTLVTGLTRR